MYLISFRSLITEILMKPEFQEVTSYIYIYFFCSGFSLKFRPVSLITLACLVYFSQQYFFKLIPNRILCTRKNGKTSNIPGDPETWSSTYFCLSIYEKLLSFQKNSKVEQPRACPFFGAKIIHLGLKNLVLFKNRIL